MKDLKGLFDTIRSLYGAAAGTDLEEDEIWKEFGTRCAVMVLDSSGFTSGTRSSGIISYLSCIVRLRDLVQPILTRHGCTGSRFATDNAYAEFHTAEKALAASCDIQRTIQSSGIEVSEGCAFGVCIGIGYGDVLRSQSEGVFGDEMNLASKLGEDLAGRGEILLTRAAFEAIPEACREDFVEKRSTVSGVEFTYYMASVQSR
ncbi:MAG: adenylate/guanylate cyclase domain-containing protein [Candidatus Fermentibacteraceae bacterium]|nr:adenylate/guanylate cyclase domain-containing protein [Candidatus Fermentibacteraceae bacterium]MBN2608345.1 adenylate/guanylate cyclase domain-containing protein [Candidatus Fermentibacteraceae bacterium]